MKYKSKLLFFNIEKSKIIECNKLNRVDCDNQDWSASIKDVFDMGNHFLIAINVIGYYPYMETMLIDSAWKLKPLDNDCTLKRKNNNNE